MLLDTWRTSNRYGVRCEGRTHHLAGEVAGHSLKNAVNVEISPITRANIEGMLMPYLTMYWHTRVKVGGVCSEDAFIIKLCIVLLFTISSLLSSSSKSSRPAGELETGRIEDNPA